MSRQPLMKWSQKPDKVLINIEIPEAKGVVLMLQPGGHLKFSATGADNVPYEMEFDLYDEVNVDESKYTIGSSNVRYIVKKAAEKVWSRLLRQEGSYPVCIEADSDKWIDEDGKLADNDNETEEVKTKETRFAAKKLDGASADKYGQDIVELLPRQVVFPCETEKESHSAICLTNISDDQIVDFKFPMNGYRMEQYKIAPLFGVLQPQARTVIRVARKPVKYDVFPIWKMMRSEDYILLEVLKAGKVVQTTNIQVYTPKPPGYDDMLERIHSMPDY